MRTLKKYSDMLLSLAALFVLSPLLFLIALGIRKDLGSPVLFRQWRPGLHGKPFLMLKFRTMRNETSSDGALLSDEERLTPWGNKLRSTSLDELPELINVVRGEMSLVGPRPLLMRYVPRYTPEQARRHDVLPGITGWAQIHGRNAISWEDKFRLDTWYVDNWSLWLDIRILVMTLQKVWKREGISAENHATMPEFMGNMELPEDLNNQNK